MDAQDLKDEEETLARARRDAERERRQGRQ